MSTGLLSRGLTQLWVEGSGGESFSLFLFLSYFSPSFTFTFSSFRFLSPFRPSDPDADWLPDAPICAPCREVVLERGIQWFNTKEAGILAFLSSLSFLSLWVTSHRRSQIIAAFSLTLLIAAFLLDLLLCTLDPLSWLMAAVNGTVLYFYYNYYYSIIDASAVGRSSKG